MAFAENLKHIAFEADRLECAVNRLSFCYDVYLSFVHDGREPSKHADGSIAMNAERATDQLCEAVNDVIGRYK